MAQWERRRLAASRQGPQALRDFLIEEENRTDELRLARRTTARAHPCPRCNAPTGSPCRTPTGARADTEHNARRKT